jgi:hypothetical protein
MCKRRCPSPSSLQNALLVRQQSESLSGNLPPPRRGCIRRVTNYRARLAVPVQYRRHRDKFCPSYLECDLTYSAARRRAILLARRGLLMEATMVRLATIAFGLALAAWASPTFAQSDRDSTSREQAVRDCNVAAGKYIEHLWGNASRQTYASCMAQRGQQE